MHFYNVTNNMNKLRKHNTTCLSIHIKPLCPMQETSLLENRTKKQASPVLCIILTKNKLLTINSISLSVVLDFCLGRSENLRTLNLYRLSMSSSSSSCCFRPSTIVSTNFRSSARCFSWSIQCFAKPPINFTFGTVESHKFFSKSSDIFSGFLKDEFDSLIKRSDDQVCWLPPVHFWFISSFAA